MTDFWQGRRVLVTGHTGFKGAWLSAWLDLLGADLVGLSLPPATSPSLWSLTEKDRRMTQVIGDIRDRHVVERAFSAGPELVFHLAAQSLVTVGYRMPADTFETNLGGTVNVLDVALQCPSVQAVLVVTSDKVYDPAGPKPFDESSAIGGRDPYAASKACCETITGAYRSSFYAPRGIGLATARAGNVIGGGDWSPDRLVPDLVRAVESRQPLLLRYPDATRPWQHVLDALHGYLLYAERLVGQPDSAPPSLNFGPVDGSGASAREVAERWSAHFDGAPRWERDSAPNPPEAPTLELSSELATEVLGWRPLLGFDDALAWTAEWYADQRRGVPSPDLVGDQIERFEKLVH